MTFGGLQEGILRGHAGHLLVARQAVFITSELVGNLVPRKKTQTHMFFTLKYTAHLIALYY